MRTTLTLEDDVAFALARLQRVRGTGFKALVNEVLREGLKQMRARPTPGKRFQTESVDLGRPRLTGIDNVAEALALAEGDAFASGQCSVVRSPSANRPPTTDH